MSDDVTLTDDELALEEQRMLEEYQTLWDEHQALLMESDRADEGGNDHDACYSSPCTH